MMPDPLKRMVLDPPPQLSPDFFSGRPPPSSPDTPGEKEMAAPNT